MRKRELEKKIRELERQLCDATHLEHHWLSMYKETRDELLELAGQLKTAECKIEDLEYTLKAVTEYQHAFDREDAEYWQAGCGPIKKPHYLEKKDKEIRRLEDELTMTQGKLLREKNERKEASDACKNTVRNLKPQIKNLEYVPWGKYHFISTGDLSDRLYGPVTVGQYLAIKRLFCIKRISLGDGYYAIVYRGFKERDKIRETLCKQN